MRLLSKLGSLTTRERKRRLDWLFWVGVAYLVLLFAFAVFGPSLRYEPNERPLRDLYDSGVHGDPSGSGMEVRFARTGSPAAAAGIQPGDIVVSADGKRLARLGDEELERVLAGKQGTTVTLVVSSAGVQRTLSLERSERLSAVPFMPPSSEFWLGTDEQGRDVFARLAFGARMSLSIGFAVQLIALFVGIVMGTLGVFAPKLLSIPILRLTDGMFAFPDILLAILIVGIWNARFEAMIIALSITAWPAVARLTRTQVASLKDREYVVASKALGAGTGYLVRKHILPHLWGILLAVAMIDVAAVILAESALSFLGIGIQAPTASWGGMIQAARINMNSYPIMLLWPCLILSLTIFALNFVGDGLRALADPKSR
jgi:ABC-type dipeptide/oligopeptide/nickel transport system permease subunit